LAEIGLFVIILFVGLIYVWAKGDLEWLKKVPAVSEPERERPRRAA
jgi:hypothetical protein